jgi:hypothetical protein
MTRKKLKAEIGPRTAGAAVAPLWRAKPRDHGATDRVRGRS